MDEELDNEEYIDIYSENFKYNNNDEQIKTAIMKLGLLAILQTFFLATGNIFLKIFTNHIPKFSWSKEFFYIVIIKNWYRIWLFGIPFTVAAYLWIYMLKHFDVSKAYPLTAMSYVFGIALAAIFLGEKISSFQWFGAILIIAGCFLVLK